MERIPSLHQRGPLFKVDFRSLGRIDRHTSARARFFYCETAHRREGWVDLSNCIFEVKLGGQGGSKGGDCTF